MSSVIVRNVFGLLFLTGLILLRVQDASAQTTLAHEPLRSLRITLNNVDTEVFIERIEKIADTLKFAYRIDRMDPGKRVILIQLWRYDIKALIGNNPRSLSEYSIFLYNTDERNPVSADVIQSTADGVKEGLSKIEGIQVRDISITR